jgi:hypothetical protein
VNIFSRNPRVVPTVGGRCVFHEVWVGEEATGILKAQMESHSGRSRTEWFFQGRVFGDLGEAIAAWAER